MSNRANWIQKLSKNTLGWGPAQRKTKTENGNCTTTYFTDYDLNFHFSPFQLFFSIAANQVKEKKTLNECHLRKDFNQYIYKSKLERVGMFLVMFCNKSMSKK